ncbi:hypothetical protein RG2014_030 [Delftia phage RG-2014]|uniref:Uncharacterized protein n=1 Tax=Delftia phage RG-2014 TaxID=1563661 RepID=A0A097PAL2_9CAUD|nr:hypothetical protein RG2014_030 [Delftia phage RG-2014]AIU44284.1 hypothetical protein RG2014_030 [Delftia phage RG-2014]
MKNTRIAGIMSLAAGLAASAGAGIANFFTGSGPTASLVKPVKTGSGSRAARSARFQASPGIFSSESARGMPVAPFYQRPHYDTPADRARIQAAQDKRDRKAAKRRAILNKQGILA